jgi:demethylmenaquinone methyltransferase/2-methoxy-6-polyprenyl-1,4-benzoquinol methylase
VYSGFKGDGILPILDHFGFVAPYYDKIFQVGDLGVLFELIDLPNNGVILDVGGGTGRISQHISDSAENVIVADLSLEMLVQAKTKTKLITACSHSEKLPFKTNQFDRVMMIDALHHVCSQQETADELWRILKPGGRIVIEEPDIRRFGVKILALVEKMLGMRSLFLPPSKIASLFNREARIGLKSNKFISWVIIEKPDSKQL